MPPAAVGSYTELSMNGVPLPRSWLRTSRDRPRLQNAAIPSCELGVGVPSSMRSPVQPYEMYSNPAGRLSSSSPVDSSRTGASGP